MKRVLVADDQPDSAELLAILLAFVGYDVKRAHDGREALRLAREWKPDLLLLDERMPGLNGSAVCRALRTDPAVRPLRAVLLSSCDEHEVPWAESGALAFLRKPLDVRALPAFVARLLGAGRELGAHVVGGGAFSRMSPAS